MLLPRSVLNAFCNPRLPILVIIITLLSGSVQSFNLKNVPKYSDNEKRSQSLGSTIKSRKNVFAELSSNSINRKAQEEMRCSFAIMASITESQNEFVASDALQRKQNLLKLVTVPIVCGLFYLLQLPSARAATATATATASFMKDSKRIILSDRQSVLIKGFISGACINFAKNILLHPIETGKELSIFFCHFIVVSLLN